MASDRDTEDKDNWVEYGEELEREFVSSEANKYVEIEEARVNPEKLTDDYAIDLEVKYADIESGAEVFEGLEGWVKTDLKHQSTPFYMAEEKYGIPPRYAVTLNRIDVQRYDDQYDNPRVLFWIERERTEDYGVEVEPISGVWFTDTEQLVEKCSSVHTPLHTYRKRVGDKYNANSSYVLDLRDFMELSQKT